MALTIDMIAAQMIDREAIRDCLYRYCRGCDRLDHDLIGSTFWPDAVAEYQAFSCRSAQEIVDTVVSTLEGMEQAKHMVGNILIDLNGDEAGVETYTLGSMRSTSPDGTRFEKLTFGRYVDRMKRRNGEWRIAKRIVVTD